MSYTRDYVFEKIVEKLPTLKIHEKKENESSIFILEYKNNKAKIDIDKKTSLSDKKLDEFVYYLYLILRLREKFQYQI